MMGRLLLKDINESICVPKPVGIDISVVAIAASARAVNKKRLRLALKTPAFGNRRRPVERTHRLAPIRTPSVECCHLIPRSRPIIRHAKAVQNAMSWVYYL
jgi:hypothetical protein